MTESALFISTFVVVFALGFQTLNVNGGHYLLAFFTSFAISGSNLVLFKLAPGAGLFECIAFMGGGPFGIVCAMYMHSRFVRPRRDSPEPRPLTADELEQASTTARRVRRVRALS